MQGMTWLFAQQGLLKSVFAVCSDGLESEIACSVAYTKRLRDFLSSVFEGAQDAQGRKGARRRHSANLPSTAELPLQNKMEKILLHA